MRIVLGHKARYHFSETAELEQRELLFSLFGNVPADQSIRVGKISPDLAGRLEARTEIVVVGAITVMKVKGKHAPILISDLELLQHAFNTGHVQQDGPRHLVFLFCDPRQPKRTMKAVIKVTRDRSELILTTYYVCTGKRLIAALKKGVTVREASISLRPEGAPS